ncbi:MAG: hypothetical protein KIH01_01845 [Candidatus Freyarchaeota archaeon]|nr:hypothetical protein [Candidatus Jordarchaeia archaeon]
MERGARRERITRLVLVLVGVVAALIGGYLFYYGLTQWLDFQRGTYLMYSFLVLVLLVYVFLALPREKRIQLTAKTVSVLRCNQCGAFVVREFERGDYVFKEEGGCRKCGSGTCFIEEIFETSLRKRTPKRRYKIFR